MRMREVDAGKPRRRFYAKPGHFGHDADHRGPIRTQPSEPRLINAIFLGAGAAAIFLPALGIFGVVSFSVSQRKRDFAIRMALGAQRRQIFALVLRRSLVHLLLGLGLGSALYFALGKPLASELIGVAAFDPQISFLVAGCVMVVALIAIILPARRATKVDPMVALRCE